MKWLARLKKIEIAPKVEPTKPTKPNDEPENRGFVGFVGSILAPMEKTGRASPAANDSKPKPETVTDSPQTEVIDNPDRWCWPNSTAMTGAEIVTFTARLARFTDKGVIHAEAELLADRLVTRDRESDDRRLCLECAHLRYGWRCGNWEQAAVAIKARDAGLPGDLVRTLQRCDGFTQSIQSQGGNHGQA
jgi:hypothetical protein